MRELPRTLDDEMDCQDDTQEQVLSPGAGGWAGCTGVLNKNKARTKLVSEINKYFIQHFQTRGGV